MEEDRGEGAQRPYPTSSETLISEPQLDTSSTCPETTLHPGEEDHPESKPELNQTEIFRALEVVERDSLAIADSFTTLSASLRFALLRSLATRLITCIALATLLAAFKNPCLILLPRAIGI